jgi:O-antigen ligase
LPWIVYLFYHHPLLLVKLWPISLLYQVLFPEVISPDSSLAQLSNYVMLLPMDMAYSFTIAFLIINAAIRRPKIVLALKENLFLSLFLVVVVASVIIYTPLYGKSAIGEARKYYFDFLFPLLTFLSIKTSRDLRSLVLVIFFVAICISIVGFMRFFINPSDTRFVNAHGALILLFAVFSILIFRINGVVIVNRAIDIVMLGMFFSIVLITHHRSVFIGGISGIFLLICLQRSKIQFVVRSLIVSIALLTLIMAILSNIPKFEMLLTKAIEGILAPHSDRTGSWRIDAWNQQLSGLSAKELLFGKGVGGYYSWIVERRKLTFEPHNAYVQIVLKMGLLGLVIYGLLAFNFFRRIFAVRKKLPPGPMRAYAEMSILNFGAAHAYMMGYGFSLFMLKTTRGHQRSHRAVQTRNLL